MIFLSCLPKWPTRPALRPDNGDYQNAAASF
jgi:hypothetical protein